MSTWVPPEQRTTAWYIFHKLYTVRVNDLARRTHAHVKKYGMIISGDAERDKHAAKQIVTCMLSIKDMAVYHSQGINVYLATPSDSKEIYELVQKHLRVWMKELSERIGPGDAPVDELIVLDNFANAAYLSAHKFLPNGKLESGFLQAMDNLFSRQIIAMPKPAVTSQSRHYIEPKRDADFGEALSEYKDIQDLRWR